jgi:hypothetical protein
MPTPPLPPRWHQQGTNDVVSTPLLGAALRRLQAKLEFEHAASACGDAEGIGQEDDAESSFGGLLWIIVMMMSKLRLHGI